jgi:hypothetical protein
VADPFAKTLIIIDEGHNLFSDDPSGLSVQERADFQFAQNMIFNSYKTSGRDSARLLVLSATPELNGINGLFQILNTFMPVELDRLPLNQEITEPLIKRIETASKKYISYYDSSTNASIFAQKDIRRILSKISKDKANIFSSHCDDQRCQTDIRKEYRYDHSQQKTIKKCLQINNTIEKIECMENALIWNDVMKNEYKYASKKFDPVMVKERLPIISTKIQHMLKNIKTLDKIDKDKHRRTFKHVIYVENPVHVNALLSGMIANDYNLATNVVQKTQPSGRVVNSMDIVLRDYPKHRNKNIAAFTAAPIYGKYLGKNLIKKMRNVFNERPDNTYGQNIRFVVIDRNFLEGVSFFDTKYIHILTIPDNEQEMTQLVGRVVRFCGHKGLPFKVDIGWNINIQIYENYDKSENIDKMIASMKNTDKNNDIKTIKKIIFEEHLKM